MLHAKCVHVRYSSFVSLAFVQDRKIRLIMYVPTVSHIKRLSSRLTPATACV